MPMMNLYTARNKKAFHRFYLMPSMLFAMVIFVGCGGGIKELPDPADATITTTDLAESVEDARNAIGKDEETYASEFLLAANEAEANAETALDASVEDNARETYVDAIGYYQSALMVADTVTGNRTLTFPADQNIGEVRTRTWGWKRGFHPLGDATGTLEIVPKVEVQLALREKVTEADLNLIAEFEPGAIQYLTFMSNNGTSEFEDKHVPLLMNIRGLSAISFHGTKLSDEGLKQIAQLRNLKHLNLIDTDVTTEGVAALAGMPALEDFAIGETKATGDIALTLKTFPKIRTIIARNVEFTDDHLQHFSELENIERLWIGGEGITDEGLQHFTEMTSLVELVFFKTSVTEDGIAELEMVLEECEILSM